MSNLTVRAAKPHPMQTIWKCYDRFTKTWERTCPINVKDIRDNANLDSWVGIVQGYDRQIFEIGSAPKVYTATDNCWMPDDYVADGQVNVYRPPNLRFDADKRRFIDAPDGEADDGGLPQHELLPKPASRETKPEWWTRCRDRFPQLNAQKPDHRKYRDEAWTTLAA